MSNSNPKEPPEKHTTPPPPPPPSLSSLPDEIVLRCLSLVPRSYHLNISWVSKHLRSLVTSPELNKLRSNLHKNSLYVCFQDKNNDSSTFHWLTLRPKEETSTTSYHLVPNQTDFTPHPLKNGSLTVAVGSKIFFIGGSTSDLWILDTKSGNITQGPSMSVPRHVEKAAVGVIYGKIYVIGGGVYSEETQVEVFDPKLETWELVGLENVREIPRCSAAVEGKVYMVGYEKTTVYNPRGCEGGGERLVQMVSERVSECGRKEKLDDRVGGVCVVEDVLFCCFNRIGVMWFDREVSLWRRLVGSDGKEMFILHADAMSGYDGKLVVFYMWGESEVGGSVMKSVRCKVVSLHRGGGRICGTIDWSGVVGLVPCSFRFLHCLCVSDRSLCC